MANGGVKVQPIIVREIKQADKVLESFESKVLNPKICSDETLAKVRAMMEGVVTEGTARGIRSQDFTMAGKTGTAWKFKNGAYTKVYSTSFCGYFPADKPKYSCIVVVDSPKKGRIYGADVAAPVFREVADKAMARDAASQRPLLARAPQKKQRMPTIGVGMQDELQLVTQHMGLPSQTATSAEDWVRADTGQGSKTLTWQEQPVQRGRVPSVVGMSLRDALFLLENRGLRVRLNGTGRVRAQSLAAGAPLQRGAVISLTLQPIGQTSAPAAPVAAPETPDLAENKLITPADPDPAKVKAALLERQRKLRQQLNGGAEQAQARAAESTKSNRK
ncbi:penicillin-binding transpeptidase domain-containing protein [Hymenobacter sp. J193]|uniref:penicillin-binding transpeptidase domain-containing protein n=1 Tax=Hymenobacter sp. J193 TaxID=2898429 RepID=UPI0027E2ACFA|nr:penicillin-binding transpeptidase domain-containing protein [Hymenobacter sp. J193]